MAKERNGYTLNCLISKELGAKLSELSENTKLPKVAIVSQALQNYFQVLEVQATIVDRLKSDPAYVARLAQLMEDAGEA